MKNKKILNIDSLSKILQKYKSKGKKIIFQGSETEKELRLKAMIDQDSISIQLGTGIKSPDQVGPTRTPSWPF